MTITLLQGDCRQVLPTLPEKSVQCVVTSPPYFGLRRYDVEGDQIGDEPTPAEYVAALVEVFAQVRRVLRDDGTLWVNLGESYSASAGERAYGSSDGSVGRGAAPGTRISSNLLNCLQARIKGGVLCFAGRYTLTISAQRQDVLSSDQIAPDGELSRLLGVKRIFIKQRDNDFCQVLNLLGSEGRLWVSRSVPLARISEADAEITIDETDHISIIVSEHNLDHQTTFGIASDPLTTKNAKMPFAIEETREPITERIRDVQANRNTIAIDPSPESVLEIDLIDDLIATREGFPAASQGLRDFSVTKASLQHFTLSMLQGRLDLTVRCVTHCYVSNAFGSLMRYTQLYYQAQRDANAQQPKQELGIPEMVKRALMRDGWICRATIIWHKPNPMPESVTDRPTRAHEYLFLFSKQARYYYDAAAIAEAVSTKTDWTYPQPDKAARNGQTTNGTGASSLRVMPADGKRNRRTVWTVATRPLKEAHYAAFPEALIEPCILAGSSNRACEHCGAPWERQTERDRPNDESDRPQARRAAQLWREKGLTDEHFAAIRSVGGADAGKAQVTMTGYGKNRPEVQRLADEAKAALGGYYREFLFGGSSTTGFRPTCACDNAGTGRSVVLDPFAGSGTTGRVAQRYGRDAVLIDLGYLDLQEKRTDGVQVEMEAFL